MLCNSYIYSNFWQRYNKKRKTESGKRKTFDFFRFSLVVRKRKRRQTERRDCLQTLPRCEGAKDCASRIKAESGKLLIFFEKNLFSKNVEKSAVGAFLCNKKRLSLRYVFAKSTYLLVGQAAVSRDAAADVGERARIKRPLHGCVAVFFDLREITTNNKSVL